MSEAHSSREAESAPVTDGRKKERKGSVFI